MYASLVFWVPLIQFCTYVVGTPAVRWSGAAHRNTCRGIADEAASKICFHNISARYLRFVPLQRDDAGQAALTAGFSIYSRGLTPPIGEGMVHSCDGCICLGSLLASPKEIGSERAVWRRRGKDGLPPPCEKRIVDLHL